MDKYSLYVPNFLSTKEYFEQKKNHTCVGCGVSLAVRHIGKACEELFNDIVFQRSPNAKFLGIKTGLAFLSLRQEKSEITFCLDDEPLSSLEDAITKKLPAIAVTDGFSYVATASVSYPFDLFDKIKKALNTEGKSYIHVLCPCPEGWQFSTEDTIKLGFWAVESRAFPLYEVCDGYYKITMDTIHPKPLSQYIKAQGRFSTLKAGEIKKANSQVKKGYARLLEIIQPD